MINLTQVHVIKILIKITNKKENSLVTFLSKINTVIKMHIQNLSILIFGEFCRFCYDG